MEISNRFVIVTNSWIYRYMCDRLLKNEIISLFSNSYSKRGFGSVKKKTPKYLYYL